MKEEELLEVKEWAKLSQRAEVTKYRHKGHFLPGKRILGMVDPHHRLLDDNPEYRWED